MHPHVCGVDSVSRLQIEAQGAPAGFQLVVVVVAVLLRARPPATDAGNVELGPRERSPEREHADPGARVGGPDSSRGRCGGGGTVSHADEMVFERVGQYGYPVR